MDPQPLSPFVWLLRTGGMIPLALGFFLGVVGLFFVLRPGKTGLLIQTFLTFAVGLYLLAAIWGAASKFIEMGNSPIAPKPAELAEVVGQAMSRGLFGLLGVLASVFLMGLIALRCREFVATNSLDSDQTGSPS